MVPKTKKTPYLGVAIAIDPDSPRRIKSKHTFKNQFSFSPKISIPRAEVTSSATAASFSYRWRSRCGAPSCRGSHSTGFTAGVYWSLGQIKIWFGNHGEMYLIGSMGLAYLPTLGWFLVVKYGKCSYINIPYMDAMGFNHPFQQKGHLEESLSTGTFLEKSYQTPTCLRAVKISAPLFQTFDQTLGLYETLLEKIKDIV